MSEQLDAGPRAPDLLSAVVLAVAGVELTGRDLLAGGVVSGRWQRLEDELSEGLGLVGAEAPPGAEVKDELREFRFARKLISAEDLRAWMAPRGLTMKDVTGVAQRAVARRRGGEPAPVTGEQVAAALPAEAICTGALREMAWWLADRMLSAAITGAEIEPPALERAAVQRLVFAESSTVAGASVGETGLQRADRLAWIVALDEAHRAWEASTTGERDVARQLRERELDWCRLEVDELRLGSSGAGAEAARQLADGAGPQSVAAAAGVEVVTHAFVLEDAPAPMRRALTGAIAGDVAGPWEDGGEHVVARVVARHAPDGTDAEILARAHATLLADGSERLRAGKVVWHDRA